MKFLTRENITLLIALIGAFGTVYDFFKKSVKVSIKLIDYTKYPNNVVHLLILLENKSANPISINSISISQDSKNIHYCELIPKILTENKFLRIFTSTFPINLQPYQGYQGYFEFLHCQEISLKQGKSLDFQIFSNQKLIKKSLILDTKEHYLPSKFV